MCSTDLALNLSERKRWVFNTIHQNFTAGKMRYLLYMRLDGPQGLSGRMWTISFLPGFDLRTVLAVASRYTDWTKSSSYM